MEAADAPSGDRPRPRTLLNLPPGYHFAPTDEELIVHYLRPKIDSLPQLLPIFKDVDVVSCRPEQITAEYKDCGEDRWFFFTKRHRKYNRGNRPNRMTPGNGFWKATGPQRMIYRAGKQEEKELVGRVRTLVFYDGATKETDKEKALSEGKTSWTMYEYENLKDEEEAANQSVDKLAEWVLCTIQEQRKKEAGNEDIGAGEKKVKETKGKGTIIKEIKKAKETKGKDKIKAASKKRKGKQEKMEAENGTDEDQIQALHLMKRTKVPMLPQHPETFAPEEGDGMGMFDCEYNSFPRKSSPVPTVQLHESPHSETMSPCVTDNNYYGPTMAPTPCLHDPPHSETTPTSAGGNYNIGSSMMPPPSETVSSTRFAGNVMPSWQDALYMEYEMTSLLGYNNHIATNMATYQPATFLHPHSVAAPHPGLYGYAAVGGFSNLLGSTSSSGYNNYADQSALWMNSGRVMSSQNLGGYLADSSQLYHGGASVLGQGRAVISPAALPLQDQVTART